MSWFANFFRSGGPILEGRPLVEWVEALRDKDTCLQAMEVLARGGRDGEPAVPALLEVIQAQPWSVRQRAAETVVKIAPANLTPLTEALADPSPDFRYWVIWILGELRTQGPALDLLVEQLQDAQPNVREAASEALWKIGSPATPALMAALRHENWRISEQAAATLARIGAEAIPALVDALRDPRNPQVRYQAAWGLGKMGQGARAAIPSLIAQLNDDTETVRGAVAAALGKIGPNAVVALITALKDPAVRRWAAWAVERIGPEAKAAIPSLANALKDADDEVRKWSARALGRIGPDARATVPHLSKALRDGNPQVTIEVARALGNIGPSAQAAVSALVASLSTEDINTKVEVMRSLGKIGAGAQAAAPTIIGYLKATEPQLRAEATSAIGRIGSAAQTAAPELLGMLGDENEQVRETAVLILTTLRSDYKLVTALMNLANAGSPMERDAANQVLSRLKQTPPSAGA